MTGFGADWYNNAIFYSVVGLQPGIYSCSVVDNSCRVVLETTSAPYSLKLHTKEKYEKELYLFKKSTRIYCNYLFGGVCVSFLLKQTVLAGNVQQ